MLVDSAKKIVSRLNEIRETSKNEFGLIRNIHPLIHQSFNKKNDKFSHLFISSDIRLVEFDIKRIGFTFGFNYTSSHRINILNSTLNKIYANTIPVYYNVNSVYNQRLVYNFCDSSYLIGIHTDPNFLNITTKFMYNNNIKNNDDFFNFII